MCFTRTHKRKLFLEIVLLFIEMKYICYKTGTGNAFILSKYLSTLFKQPPPTTTTNIIIIGNDSFRFTPFFFCNRQICSYKKSLLFNQLNISYITSMHFMAMFYHIFPKIPMIYFLDIVYFPVIFYFLSRICLYLCLNNKNNEFKYCLNSCLSVAG